MKCIVSHRECLNNITTFLKDSWTWDAPLDGFDKQWCDQSAWTLGEETEHGLLLLKKNK